jgi:carbonic anhydrase
VPSTWASNWCRSGGGTFYRYDGSLTTPPCTESVTWFVLRRRQTVSQAQVDAFNSIERSPANNRPFQLTNGRPVRDSILSTAGLSYGALGCPTRRFTSSRQLAEGATAPWDFKYPQCWAEDKSPINIDTTGRMEEVGDSMHALTQYATYESLNNREVENTGHGLTVSGSFGAFFDGWL